MADVDASADFDFSAAEAAAEQTLAGQSNDPGTEGAFQSQGASTEQQGYDEPTAGRDRNDQAEQEQRFTYFDPEAETAKNMLFKLKHGEREIDLTYEDVRNLAEQGFDYTQKRQRDADTLRWAEENRPKFEAYEKLGERLRSDPEVAAVLAAMDNPGFRQMLRQNGFFGGMQAAGNQYGQFADPQVQQLQSELNQLRQQQQHQQLTQQQEQVVSQLRSQWDKLKSEYPDFFNGPLAARNEMRLQQAALELEQRGIVDLNYAFHQAFGDELGQMQQRQTISNYVRGKTKQGPSVQGSGGGSPSGRKAPKTLDDAWDMADQAASERLSAAL